MATPAGYLICYDISDPKRLGRLQRFVSGYAVMVQYSVYLAWLTPASLDVLEEGIRHRINPHADDVRIYPLPGHLDVEVFRRGDEDVWILGCDDLQRITLA
jgi:CRISPR-associated protein Cas2